MNSVEKDDKPDDAMIDRESTLKLRGVEKSCQGRSTSRRKGKERSRATVVFLADGRVKPKEGA